MSTLALTELIRRDVPRRLRISGMIRSRSTSSTRMNPAQRGKRWWAAEALLGRPQCLEQLTQHVEIDLVVIQRNREVRNPQLRHSECVGDRALDQFIG